MPPKYQSPFIPKGPMAATMSPSMGSSKKKEKDLFSFLTILFFSLSVILALGVFGYKYFLNYRIDSLGQELENARAALAPETVSELIALDNRIVTTEKLLGRHRVLSPVFKFLESSTPKTVRFSQFEYTETEKGIQLIMHGEANGYASLALQADLFNRNSYFKNTVFSDLRLDAKGNVTFSLTTIINPELLSYNREVEDILPPPAPPILVPTPTATTTPR